MARTAEEISRTIRARLKVLDPDLSAEPGTVERKIVDTVAETVAEAEIDQFVLQYQFDIDTRVGDDLDRFASLFGFARMRGRRAVGTVTFERTTVAERDIIIAAGTQVIKPSTSVTPAIVFYTTATVTLYQGTTAVNAPIESLEVGDLGNVPAGSITSLGVADALGVSSITNLAATTGGDTAEDDASFRIRFKNMVFRNVAGTRDQFLALAIASRFSKKANVVGPISRFSEYIQVPSASPFTTGSVLPYAKYIYNFDYYLTSGDPGTETFYSPTGDYSLTINNGVSPATSTLNANIIQTTTSAAYTFPMPSAVLGIAMTNVQTTMQLSSITGFPVSYPFYVSIDSEIIRVDSLASGTTYNVTRAQGGTTGVAHNDLTKPVTQAIQVASTASFGTAGTLKIGTTISFSTVTYGFKATGFFGGLSGGQGSYGSGTDVTQGTLARGQVVLLEQSYCSISSRNDPATNVMNYVDVFVSGQDVRDALESMRFPGAANNVVNSAASAFHQTKYVRAGTTTNPTVGNKLIFPLWQPVIQVPSTLTIAGNLLTKGIHYWHIKDNTLYQGSRRSRDGIEFASSVSVVENTEFILDYDFDRLPMALNELMDTYKQITQDVLVHSAIERYFIVYLAVMYTPGFSTTAVDANIVTALTELLEEKTFGTTIQFSDIVNTVTSVTGVDAARIARQGTPPAAEDAANYGIQEVDSLGVDIGVPKTTDFALQDDELPVLSGIVTYRKSQNSWSF